MLEPLDYHAPAQSKRTPAWKIAALCAAALACAAFGAVVVATLFVVARNGHFWLAASCAAIAFPAILGAWVAIKWLTPYLR